MSPEKKRVEVACGDEESVLHVPGGVVWREVEGFEDMIIILDFGALGDIITEFAEYVHNLLPDY